MNKNMKELNDLFEKISQKGWIVSQSLGTGGVGETFEYQLGLKRNSKDVPDFNGIEIKTKRSNSNHYITLFSTSCDGENANSLNGIKDMYGWPDYEFTDSKVLRIKLFANKFSYLRNGIKMKLDVDYARKKIYLCIYNKYNKIINNSAYWSFELLENKLFKKLKYLAFIDSINKFNNGNELFKYKKITFYNIKNFSTFIRLINDGIIIIELKFGVRRSGDNAGKTYDHGAGFEILPQNIEMLFNRIYDYE